MQTTPILGLPYVEPADAIVDFPAVSEQLAETAEDAIRASRELYYGEQGSDVAVTATTVGGAVAIITAGAITFEAVPILIEFFCPVLVAGATAGSFVILKDGATVLGTICRAIPSTGVPLHAVRRLTPSAGSHSYTIAAWHASAGTDTYNAGAGGTAGDASTDLPIFLRIARA